MDNIIRRWYDMIRINSISGNEVYLANYIAGELRAMGLEPHYSYFPEDVELKVRPSIWTQLESGKAGKTLMLIGHLDTVEIARGWDTDPFVPTEVDDKVYGLGAMDMKGGIAAILETLDYYTQHTDEFTGCIKACFVADEEVLSKGTYQLVEEGITADMAIMAECRYDSMAIGFRGRYSLEVSVYGEAAHNKNYPDVGRSALIMGCELAKAIEKLPTLKHGKLKTGTWCVRHMEAGVRDTLSVPDTCEMLIDRYVVPGEDEFICIKQIEDLAVRLGIGDCVKARLKPRNSPYMQPFSLDENHPLVLCLQKQFKAVTGKELTCIYDPSVCDSNILAISLGVPTVTFGPAGGGMHAANEYGLAHQVSNCAKIYRRTVSDLLQ